MAKLNDNTGQNWGAKVSKSNRLYVTAVQQSEQGHATNLGNSYNINTGLITLTTAGESGVLYLKSNEDNHLYISAVVLILGPATAGSATDTTRIRVYKNPTTGTLISAATNVDTNSNRNFSSSKTLAVNAYKGVEGSTITNGTTHIESLIDPGTRVFFNINEVLTKGDSIAVSIEPNDSTTNMKVMSAIVCHLGDVDL